jgi:bifunctional non-homologous end joining protein LigD
VTIAKRRARPAFVEPMTAKVVSALPEGEAWLYEVKLDGYRALIIKDGARVSVISRNEKDLTSAYPGVATAHARSDARVPVAEAAHHRADSLRGMDDGWAPASRRISRPPDRQEAEGCASRA